MAKKSKTDGKELTLIAKAIRRAEKLERTLTKLTRVNEPRSHAEALLKAVQTGLKALRKEPAVSKGETKAPKKAKAVKSAKSDEAAAAPVVVKRVRKPKAPASKTPAPKTPDIVLLADTKAS